MARWRALAEDPGSRELNADSTWQMEHRLYVESGVSRERGTDAGEAA